MKSKFLLAFVFLFGLSLVSAACTEDQVIMKLYSATNSHVASWSGANYNYQICYNEIFGVNSTHAAPHTCTASNVVIWANADTNAHASATQDAVYGTSFCYGDLTCHVTNAECSSGEQIVIRLSAATNAHASIASDTNYVYKVCCKQSSGISAGYWSDLMGDGISTADLGDYVKLNLEGSGLTGKNVSYTLYKNDQSFWSFSWLFGSEEVQIIGEDETGSAYWQANEAGTYYFIANLDGNEIDSRDSANYGTLVVSNTVNKDKTTIDMSSPLCGKNIVTGDTINVNFNVINRDSLLNLTIDLGNGSVLNYAKTVPKSYSYSVTYNTAGNIKVMVNSSNNGWGHARTISNIMVINPSVNGEYVAACIAEPKDFSYLMDSSVKFNASTSRGLVYTASNSSYYFIVPGEEGAERLKFDWIFAATDGTEQSTFSKTGDYTLAYLFTKQFEASGAHTASLSVDLI